MVSIDGTMYQYQKLHRYVNIAKAMMDRPVSSFYHFTFICDKSKPVAIGFNDVTSTCNRINRRLITYPLGGRHSELSALQKIKNLDDCKNFTLVNIRLNNKGELRLSKPCDVCQNLILSLGIKRLYFSINNGFEYQDLRSYANG